jgi:hypothetical protein
VRNYINLGDKIEWTDSVVGYGRGIVNEICHFWEGTVARCQYKVEVLYAEQSMVPPCEMASYPVYSPEDCPIRVDLPDGKDYRVDPGPKTM